MLTEANRVIAKATLQQSDQNEYREKVQVSQNKERKIVWRWWLEDLFGVSFFGGLLYSWGGKGSTKLNYPPTSLQNECKYCTLDPVLSR